MLTGEALEAKVREAESRAWGYAHGRADMGCPDANDTWKAYEFGHFFGLQARLFYREDAVSMQSTQGAWETFIATRGKESPNNQ